MSSNSDDSVSLSGSKSELDLDDIFGESDEDDNDFQEFLNKKFQLKFSVKGCEKLTTTANILHHLMRQMLALLEITQGRTQPRILVCFRMKKFLSTLTHEPTGMPLRSKAKICGSTELHGPLHGKHKLRAFFGVWMAMNDFIEKPLDGVLQVTGGKEREQYLCQYTE